MTSLYLLIFIFGLIVGSFLNVLIYRTENKESFVLGRSHCPKCRKKIAWYDNIPIVSFFILKRCCRNCGQKISWQYPLVEMATAFLLVLTIYEKFSPLTYQTIFYEIADFKETIDALVRFLFYLLALGLLISIFVYDLKHYLIPDQFVFSGVILTFIFNLYLDWKVGNHSLSFNSISVMGIVGAFLAASFFFLLAWGSKGKWMGWGDVKYVLFMGLLLGYPRILVGLFIAFLTGSVVGLILISLQKKGLKSEIPFGPFLCLGTYIVWLWGSDLWELYERMFI